MQTQVSRPAVPCGVGLQAPKVQYINMKAYINLLIRTPQMVSVSKNCVPVRAPFSRVCARARLKSAGERETACDLMANATAAHRRRTRARARSRQRVAGFGEGLNPNRIRRAPKHTRAIPE